MKRGFTVIEMVAAMAVVMILAAIAVPQIHGAQLDAKQAEAQVNMDSLSAAVAAYTLDDDSNLGTETKPWTSSGLQKE